MASVITAAFFLTPAVVIAAGPTEVVYHIDDADEQDRYRGDRSGPARLTLKCARSRGLGTAVVESRPNVSASAT
ncbi:MAG: hypothetical protein B7Z19_07080 [Polynucleobacter sp. 32-46-5]|nr:MAG: hypothetical protein B7Z19_07080 [Polynucleobacter sp. 32-46-5]